MTKSDKNFFKKTAEFIPQVKQEVKKVTWPGRQETTLTTVFVFVFAMVAAVYFLLVDQVIFRIINWLIGLSG